MLSSSLERWKRAVVHLECAGDSEDRISEIDALFKRLVEGEITKQDYQEQMANSVERLEGIRDVRQCGTALYVTHSAQKFLVTARHVVWDKVEGEREMVRERERWGTQPSPFRELLLIQSEERCQNQVFRLIFRVPTLDESQATSKERIPPCLMHAGFRSLFSDPRLDLAVICLTDEDRFVRDLEREGYEPIPSHEIADGPSNEGANVFTVGFPVATSVIGQRQLDFASWMWGSDYLSVPAFAFGKVSMLHPTLDFFWCDISAYPGNSGGPIVEDDRLVGVVSQQAYIPLDGDPSEKLLNRIPFARAIKGKHVLGLLDRYLKRWSKSDDTVQSSANES